MSDTVGTYSPTGTFADLREGVSVSNSTFSVSHWHLVGHQFVCQINRTTQAALASKLDPSQRTWTCIEYLMQPVNF